MLFLPREHKIHIFELTCNVFLLYELTDDGVFDDFPKIFDHFPKISEDFPKLFCQGQKNAPEHFPKISEDVRRFPKTPEDFRGRPELRCFDDTTMNLSTIKKTNLISVISSISKRIRPFISESTALQIYQALILPHFDYCSPVWDELSVTLSDKLQTLQNRAARVITRSSYDTSASILLNRLNWHNLSTRRKKLKATLMFKIIKGLSPEYLQDLFSIRSTKYNLRDSEIKLNLLKPRANYCKRASGYSGALLWNSLPVHLRKSDSLRSFKRELDKFYSNCQSGSHTAIL